MQPANQRGRRSWRHALRQYPQLLLKAPAPPPLRAGENLAANLPSPRMSTPEALPFDQPRVIHCVAASKGGSIQLNTPSARRPSAAAYLEPPFAKVVLPASAPTIFTGIRLAAAHSILVLIAAEMVGSKAGLGYFVNAAEFN